MRERPYGIPFIRATLMEIVELALRTAEQPRLFCTCNLNHLRVLQIDADFQEAYQKAAIVTLDSRPIKVLARIQLRQSLPLITGADLFEMLIERLRPGVDRPFFVASSQVVANELINKLLARGFTAGTVSYATPPFGFESNQAYSDHLVEQLHRFSPTHLFMGVGAPKSEIWISRRFGALPSANIFCVGAALDFTSGLKGRAPLWLRKLGLEWLHRLASEPRRLLPRYAGDVAMLIRMIARQPLVEIHPLNVGVSEDNATILSSGSCQPMRHP